MEDTYTFVEPISIGQSGNNRKIRINTKNNGFASIENKYYGAIYNKSIENKLAENNSVEHNLTSIDFSEALKTRRPKAIRLTPKGMENVYSKVRKDLVSYGYSDAFAEAVEDALTERYSDSSMAQTANDMTDTNYKVEQERKNIERENIEKENNKDLNENGVTEGNQVDDSIYDGIIRQFNSNQPLHLKEFSNEITENNEEIKTPTEKENNVGESVASNNENSNSRYIAELERLKEQYLKAKSATNTVIEDNESKSNKLAEMERENQEREEKINALRETTERLKTEQLEYIKRAIARERKDTETFRIKGEELDKKILVADGSGKKLDETIAVVNKENESVRKYGDELIAMLGQNNNDGYENDDYDASHSLGRAA